MQRIGSMRRRSETSAILVAKFKLQNDDAETRSSAATVDGLMQLLDLHSF